MVARKPELLLLRHGIAEDREAPHDDAQRSLTPVGRDRAARVIQRLVAMEFGCDLVLSSPLVRARQTAELAVAWGLAPELELAAALAPLADPLPLLERWLGLAPTAGEEAPSERNTEARTALLATQRQQRHQAALPSADVRHASISKRASSPSADNARVRARSKIISA